MKATTRRGAAGGLPAAKQKKRKKPPPARGFMCGCGGAKSVSTVSISTVTSPPMLKAAEGAAPVAKPAAKATADDADAEVTPSVGSLLQQLRELERGVRALGVRDQRDNDDGGGGCVGSAARSAISRPRRHTRSASDWGGGGVGRLDAESVAVVTESEDPLGDFRRSMAQMIVENGITGGAELRELLRRFLSLNAACHHHLILRAFADVWEELFAGGGHYYSHAPPHHLPPPAAEEKIISCSSSRATPSKRPAAALTR